MTDSETDPLRRQIEDLKAEVARLQQSENEAVYRSLFENNHAVMLLIDPETAAIRDANPAACAYYGWSRDEIKRLRIDQINLLTAEDVCAQMELARSEQRRHFFFRHRRADGSVRDVEVYSGPLTVKGQTLLYSIVHDMTDRMRAQKELAERDKAKLEDQNRQLQKAESLGRMAGAIAHRFNNLLGVVLGNLEMVMNVLPSESAAVENLIDAIQAARKTAEVSGLMLTYLGQSRAKADALDLAAACRRSLETIRSGMPKEVLLKCDLPSNGPVVRANAAQLQQALTNICTNAWEAIGAGRGTVQVAVKVVSPDEIAAANRFPLDWHPREFPHACIEVADSGCGIAGKDMEKLFDPFFSSKFTGRGLGLPVVLGVAKACGGGVTVESKPGKGSTFRLFFPVEEQAPAIQPDRAGQPFRFEAGGTVLLAEDEEMLRKLTAAALNGLGLNVIAAGDGDEAIEAFRRHQEEILFVLLDLTMPRVNGWETLEALRTLCPGVRVILTSGFSEAHVMNGEHLTLPNVFLAKPYDRNELISAISRVLAGQDGVIPPGGAAARRRLDPGAPLRFAVTGTTAAAMRRSKGTCDACTPP